MSKNLPFLMNLKIEEIFKFSKCLCEDKKIFLKCQKCIRKYIFISDIFRYYHDEMFILKKSKGNICILNEFWLDCKEISIGSHSISKKSHLSTLGNLNNKSVYSLGRDNSFILKKNRISLFKKISYEEIASIFYGLCKKHDDIYNPIDNKFDYSNYQHLILLAHRQSLYELNKKIDLINNFKTIKKIFNKISREKLSCNYKNNINEIIKSLNLKINENKIIKDDLQKNINDFKSCFDIVINNTGKALFKNKEADKYLYSIIKFDKNIDFSFSTLFAPKYLFNKEDIYPLYYFKSYNLKSPAVGLINHKENSYFYCVCLKNKDNLKFIKNLTKGISSNINDLLKIAIMNDNTYYSESFYEMCKLTKIPQKFYDLEKINKDFFDFDTVDKLLGYLYLNDSECAGKQNPIDGEAMRIESINSIDYLDIIKPMRIIDIITKYN